MKILLLEDDSILGELLFERLGQSADVVHVRDGESALNVACAQKFDLLLLDVNVPKIDGFELLKSLRNAGDETPAIFITAKTSVGELKKGFDVGAHDYIRKPFEFEELQIRMSRLVKQNDEKLPLGSGVFLSGRSLFMDGKEIFLPQKESALLNFLVRHKGEFVDYEKICANLWSLDEYPSEATVRTYIKNLRKVLHPDCIGGVRGMGWRFDGI